MLNSITIQNFKAIQGKKPLELKNLAKVNYLVGPNGCGKSSVLEGVQFISNWNDKNTIFNNEQPHYNPLKLKGLKPPFHGSSEHLDPNSYVKKSFKLTLNQKYNFELKNYKINYNENIIEHKCITLYSTSFDSWQSDYQNFWTFLFGFLEKNKSEEWADFVVFEKLATSIQTNKSFKKFFVKSLNDLYRRYVETWGKINSIADLRMNNFYQSPKGNISEERNRVIKILKSLFYDFKDEMSNGENLLYFFILNLVFLENLGYKIILIEEFETHLHPKWQKKLPQIFKHFPSLQFLISTHSPFIIREALELDNQNVYHIEEGQTKNMLNKEKIKKGGVLSFDRAIADLGFEMRDIYYPNCLIYVEGPVDKIYIEYWLQKYIEIENKEGLKRNFDYEFVEYGGSLASHLVFDPSFKNPKSTDENFRHSLFNVFSLNRKVFFITDNDANKKRAFHSTKKRIEKVLTKLEDCSFYKESNPNIDTIEKYLRKNAKKSTAQSKVDVAIVNRKHWDKKQIGFEDFEPEAKKLAQKIYEFIIQK
jgi:predicted ATP-dependent endonuclease of OLD family